MMWPFKLKSHPLGVQMLWWTLQIETGDNSLNYFLLQCVAFAATIVYASFFEWTLHRYFMHQISFGLRYPFKAHAQVHHHVFKSDQSYLWRPGIDIWLITFAWWNFPLILLLNSPFLIVMEWMGWHVSVGVIAAMSTYYFLYEYLHFAMHKPEGRLVEKWRLFKFINRHHLIHHKFMHRNLNVVLPLADFLLGTLILHPKTPIEEGDPRLTPEKPNTLTAV